MKNKLLLLLVSTLFVSCSKSMDIKPSERVLERPIYLKCQIPEIPKTRFNSTNSTSYPIKFKTITDYLFDLKKENELLREVINNCR